MYDRPVYFANTWNRAFTLIELLVTIAIVGSLLALLLPAIQAAREAARRATCQSNLRQLGIALLAHHDAKSAFPSGGWGSRWLPVEARGSGRRQPGGWAFAVLPFLELGSIQRLADGATPKNYESLLSAPTEIWNCPSRRPAQLESMAAKFAHPHLPVSLAEDATLRRGDYAINSGVTSIWSCPGPADLAEGDGSKAVCGEVTIGNVSSVFALSGISHYRAACTLANVLDGASQTYLAGEKYVSTAHYGTGESLGDRETLLSGYSLDNHRFTLRELTPLADSAVVRQSDDHLRFGSAHPGGTNMSFCDGSLRWISFSLDPEMHYRAGHIADQGAPLEP